MARTETSGASVRTIAVEPLTQDAFAPYGDVLEPRGEALPHVYGDTMDVYQPGMHECDVETEFIVTRYRLREPRVLFLERHNQITQTFIPMGGDPFVLTVAAPDAPLENGLPVLDSVRAFLVLGDARQPLLQLRIARRVHLGLELCLRRAASRARLQARRRRLAELHAVDEQVGVRRFR